jgi:phosphate transport system substrate-binding protein
MSIPADSKRTQLRSATAGALLGAVALAGGVVATTLRSPGAGAEPPLRASYAHLRTSHAKSAKVSAGQPSYASVEKELSALEHPPAGVSLQETGSTLLYPLISAWAHSYRATKVTTAGTGSGTGIADATSGTVQIGASDAYLPPSAPKTLLNIPLDVSAQQIDYNLPGLGGKTHLQLNGTVLNDIYDGTITTWNAPAIRKLNPGIKLPNERIVPLHRSDGSGDTFLFSTYLSKQDPSGWVNAHGGPGTTVSWPSVPTALAEQGNGGMLAGCEKTPGCIAYIGISYLRSALKAGLGDARLENGSGNYVLPTPANIESEVASFHNIPSSAAISLIDSKSARYGYPIVNFEYAIVSQNQPSATVAQAIRAFLAWGMDPRHGSSTAFLSPIYFHPLAPGAMQIAVNLLKKVQ